MKLRTIDLWLPAALAVIFLVTGLLASGPGWQQTGLQMEENRGWKALEYLIPYLMIFAVEPMERHWCRFRRRRRLL